MFTRRRYFQHGLGLDRSRAGDYRIFLARYRSSRFSQLTRALNTSVSGEAL
jgi:hypothetical protein